MTFSLFYMVLGLLVNISLLAACIMLHKRCTRLEDVVLDIALALTDKKGKR